MLRYPARFVAQVEGGFVVTFPDIPEAITQGEDREDALLHARDALQTALEFYFDGYRSVPAPSRLKRGHMYVELPSSVAAKVLLLNEMIEQKVRPVELARRLHTTPQEVNRLTDIRHTSRIGGIAGALKALGKTLEVRAV